MHAMVDNLLLLARADARQLTTDAEPVELRSFIQECWLPFEARAQARRLQVEWKLELNGEVKLDREKTRIVLNNLFDNAVTYTDDGGKVQITAGTEAGRTTLRVENSGSRVSPADAEKLFDRFWRGDEARSDVGTHCGLGLSLCRKIVDLLGGTLSADSRDGQFSASVSIPTPGV
jgi:signal transduction histidine kinase